MTHSAMSCLATGRYLYIRATELAGNATAR